MKEHTRIPVAALVAILLGGCAISNDAGRGEVDAMVATRIGQPLRDSGNPDALEARVASLLAQPLGRDEAVQLAVLNHPGLQEAYAELDIARADLAQAGLLRNPGFSFAHFRSGAEREIERKLIFDVVGLVTMPWRLQAERASFASTQVRVAREVVRIADEARRAWTEAVAAAEDARYAGQVKDAAHASAELAREMVKAGNFSRLVQAREEAFLADAEAQVVRAQHAAAAARESLVRATGLADRGQLRLHDRLPDPPAMPRDVQEAETRAVSERLDVRAARLDAQALDSSLALARANRVASIKHLTLERDSKSDMPPRRGYEVEIELPIFDAGAARIARTEASQAQARARLAQAELRARSEVRESFSAYRAAFEVARRYRDQIVPLRKQIGEENLLRYNGMLLSVFDLIAGAREQVAVVRASMQATRDFWMADANLETAISTGSPASFELKGSPAMPTTADTGH